MTGGQKQPHKNRSLPISPQRKRRSGLRRQKSRPSWTTLRGGGIPKRDFPSLTAAKRFRVATSAQTLLLAEGKKHIAETLKRLAEEQERAKPLPVSSAQQGAAAASIRAAAHVDNYLEHRSAREPPSSTRTVPSSRHGLYAQKLFHISRAKKVLRLLFQLKQMLFRALDRFIYANRTGGGPNPNADDTTRCKNGNQKRKWYVLSQMIAKLKHFFTHWARKLVAMFFNGTMDNLLGGAKPGRSPAGSGAAPSSDSTARTIISSPCGGPRNCREQGASASGNQHFIMETLQAFVKWKIGSSSSAPDSSSARAPNVHDQETRTPKLLQQVQPTQQQHNNIRSSGAKINSQLTAAAARNKARRDAKKETAATVRKEHLRVAHREKMNKKIQTSNSKSKQFFLGTLLFYSALYVVHFNTELDRRIEDCQKVAAFAHERSTSQDEPKRSVFLENRSTRRRSSSTCRPNGFLDFQFLPRRCVEQGEKSAGGRPRRTSRQFLVGKTEDRGQRHGRFDAEVEQGETPPLDDENNQYVPGGAGAVDDAMFFCQERLWSCHPAQEHVDYTEETTSFEGFEDGRSGGVGVLLSMEEYLLKDEHEDTTSSEDLSTCFPVHTQPIEGVLLGVWENAKLKTSIRDAKTTRSSGSTQAAPPPDAADEGAASLGRGEQVFHSRHDLAEKAEIPDPEEQTVQNMEDVGPPSNDPTRRRSKQRGARHDHGQNDPFPIPPQQAYELQKTLTLLHPFTMLSPLLRAMVLWLVRQGNDGISVRAAIRGAVDGGDEDEFYQAWHDCSNVVSSADRPVQELLHQEVPPPG
eukprot:GSA120T00021920001.1